MTIVTGAFKRGEAPLLSNPPLQIKIPKGTTNAAVWRGAGGEVKISSANCSF
jgi:hypothetical protein